MNPQLHHNQARSLPPPPQLPLFLLFVHPGSQHWDPWLPSKLQICPFPPAARSCTVSTWNRQASVEDVLVYFLKRICFNLIIFSMQWFEKTALFNIYMEQKYRELHQYQIFHMNPYIECRKIHLNYLNQFRQPHNGTLLSRLSTISSNSKSTAEYLPDSNIESNICLLDSEDLWICHGIKVMYL